MCASTCQHLGKGNSMAKRLLIAFVLLVGIFCFSTCGGGDGHCRIYLANDGTGTMDSLHVVDSPANSNWGSDLLNEPAEYLSDNPTWRIFRFDEGRRLDVQLNYTTGGYSGTMDEESSSCDDGEGVKYEISGDRMFRTTFNFSH